MNKKKSIIAISLLIIGIYILFFLWLGRSTVMGECECDNMCTFCDGMKIGNLCIGERHKSFIRCFQIDY